MNTINDLIQMMQLSAAAQTQRTQSSQRRESEKDGESGSFDQLLRERTESAEQPRMEGSDAEAAQEETTPDETLREVAAAMTVMMMQAPAQIRTEEVQPQTAQPVTLTAELAQQTQLQPAQQTAQTEVLPAQTPAVETVQTMAQPTDAGTTDASLTETAMPQQTELTAPRQTEQPRNGETADQRQDGEAMDRSGRADDVKVENAPRQTEQPVFHEVKSVPVKVGETLDTADAESPKLDAQLTQSVTDALKDGAKQVKLQLNPENLGTLTIDLTQTQDGALQVVLHTTTDKAADLLGRHAESLGAMLQGNTQSAVTVQVQRQEQTQQFQQFQQNAQHQQQDQPRHNSRRQSGEDFLQQLRLGLVTLEELAV